MGNSPFFVDRMDFYPLLVLNCFLLHRLASKEEKVGLMGISVFRSACIFYRFYRGEWSTELAAKRDWDPHAVGRSIFL